MEAKAATFVRIIEEYPCLYNNKLAEHSRKDVTDKAWSEVAQKANSCVSDCQTRWRNIRNGFVRSLKPTPCGSSTKQKKLYYLHDELQFVLPFIKATVYTGEPANVAPEIEMETESEEADNISNSSIKELAETVKTTAEEYSESFLTKLQRAKIRKVNNEVDNLFLDWIRITKEDNPRKMFLLSLLPDVESLSEEQMRKFRIKVLFLLEDIRSSSSQKCLPEGNNKSPSSPTHYAKIKF